MSNDQTHDDLDPMVEAAAAAGRRMSETGTRIEARDHKYHTGGRDFLLRMAALMV